MRKLYFLVLVCFATATNAQVINFPDANFKALLLASDATHGYALNFQGQAMVVDANADGEIEVSEALLVRRLQLLQNQNVTNLGGIQFFSNLATLSCYGTNVTTIDVSGLTNLSVLHCYDSQVTGLTVSGCTALQSIICYNNHLTSLDLHGLTNLSTVYCYDNDLNGLNLNGLPNLLTLLCQHNQLELLNVNGLFSLKTLSVAYNHLSALDLTGLTQLLEVRCNDNQISDLNMAGLESINRLFASNNRLTSIDMSMFPHLDILECANNLLTSINIKNGNSSGFEEPVYFIGNPNLTYICFNDEVPGLIEYFQAMAISYGMPNLVFNSYCNFGPGGKYYSVQGSARIDVDNNGCSASDVPYPYFRLDDHDADGNLVRSYRTNASGQFDLPLRQGTHVMTPVFENPSYFSASPSSAMVSFPTQASPALQDFCIVFTESHPDLDIVVVPLGPARPGFDANYKIIYRNKGTVTQSGSIYFAFNDAVLDLVTASPAISGQFMNYLNWNFTDLHPFESRSILVTLNVNSPLEVPAVNLGFLLDFSAALTTQLTDETPVDNTFVLHQVVVNSFDPNDKTCLEGTTITPEMTGKYVHYVVRFENTGSFNAENIVVKDLIDPTQFDINSLVPMDSSHPFVTKVSGNKVEFIFENINLPFDDAHNDGYVMFKIKTKPSLGLGDTFSNTASIYFDYNAPIVTNTATTTVNTLATADFAFENHFRIYPNPVANSLNIETIGDATVKSISIYNVLGQLLLVVPNAENLRSIDVSNLSSGNYLLQINSEKGIANTKFIKV